MANLYSVTIIRLVSERTGVSQPIVKRVMDGLRETIKDRVLAGDRIYWTHLAAFVAATRGARRQYNPGSGLYVEIPPVRRLKVTPDKDFLAKIKEGDDG